MPSWNSPAFSTPLQVKESSIAFAANNRTTTLWLFTSVCHNAANCHLQLWLSAETYFSSLLLMDDSLILACEGLDNSSHRNL